ncbi:MAG: multicopper oxidase domain-containing protein [Clostridiaceae bacterium]|nr:multicopper oxidase domain-containing protein [Clostridiaceae bacterium]
MSNPLDPNLIPRFVNQLVIPPVFYPKTIYNPTTCEIISHNYTITMTKFLQQILPSEFPRTTVWGYGGAVIDPSDGKSIIKFRNSPAATFEATRGIPINVQWINNIFSPHSLPVDPTLHWADPNNLGMVIPDLVPPFPPGLPDAQYPVPVVPHLHGGEDHSIFDGHPDAWFTANEEKTGPEFVTTLYHYPNNQLPTTLWYHDHALGITRLNVLMGLAGFYLLRDPKNPLDSNESVLPSKEYEIPIVIQDRSFNTDGSFNFPNVGNNPDVHPYWVPEFLGDTIMVNGSVWPNLNVKRRQYRFRLLNGSNARFYNLEFSNKMSFIQIGTDGGYLAKPVELSSLLLAPGERADILVDFSSIDIGTELILNNSANAPFPNGNLPDPLTTGQIMKFTVLASCITRPTNLPETLNKIPKLSANSKTRTLVLLEVAGENGPLEALLDGQKWSAPISELPIVGSTEKWELVNLTMDTHPIHLHLVQFLISTRQTFRAMDYMDDWIKINGEPPLNHPTEVLPVNDYLEGDPLPPDPNEAGWKDTIRANPGEVTTILVRFAPQESDKDLAVPGVNLYPFNPTSGPGYVWHCHILDHEDNEMMRPYKVVN